MEAVVWTVAYWVEAALRHSQDPPQAEREVARTHIRNAPAEVRTPLRDKVEEVFGQNELSDTALFVGDVEDWTFSRRGHLPRAPHRKMCADNLGDVAAVPRQCELQARVIGERDCAFWH